MTKECLFSGEPSENIEHVIPRWLARKYKLSNQTYTLPNGTHIKYKHAKVPSKKSHNDKFSLIEDNIASGVYDPFEVYLWAFKIHIGLKYIDKDLPIDRKDKASDKILDDEYVSKMLKLFRILYLAWSSGKIIPDVLGSVIIEDSKLPEEYFDMMDMLHGFFAIWMDGKIIIVSIIDFKALENFGSSNILKKDYLNDCTDTKELILKQKIFAIRSFYFVYRHYFEYIILINENSLTIELLNSLCHEYDESELEFFMNRHYL